MHKLALGILLFAGSSMAAGPLVIGVRGGVPLIDILDSVQDGGGISTATKNYVVGPTVGVRLPLGLSVEGDALFSRLDVDARGTAGSLSFNADSWEFPVMLKFTAGSQGIAPFLGAGVSVRHLSDFGDAGRFLANTFGRNVEIKNNTVGFVLGGGLRFQAGPLAISPEIRYTRWGTNNIGEGFRDFLRSNKNQAQILMGLTF